MQCIACKNTEIAVTGKQARCRLPDLLMYSEKSYAALMSVLLQVAKDVEAFGSSTDSLSSSCGICQFLRDLRFIPESGNAVKSIYATQSGG